jgi:hypothetical protein
MVLEEHRNECKRYMLKATKISLVPQSEYVNGLEEHGAPSSELFILKMEATGFSETLVAYIYTKIYGVTSQKTEPQSI